MTRHSFSVGDEVRFDPGIFERTSVAGSYCVVKLLPPDGADLQYRVRSLSDGHERVAREFQLLR
ncbi:MAG: hypothetical protein U1E53_24050 [Dongiaceae bacterium]